MIYQRSGPRRQKMAARIDPSGQDDPSGCAILY